jgi:hypothetical protein
LANFSPWFERSENLVKGTWSLLASGSLFLSRINYGSTDPIEAAKTSVDAFSMFTIVPVLMLSICAEQERTNSKRVCTSDGLNNHRFRSAVQLSTTVIGTGEESPVLVLTIKCCPSRVAALQITPSEISTHGWS